MEDEPAATMEAGGLAETQIDRGRAPKKNVGWGGVASKTLGRDKEQSGYALSSCAALAHLFRSMPRAVAFQACRSLYMGVAFRLLLLLLLLLDARAHSVADPPPSP